ncbi:MAG TPA: LPS export ABC transporter permease LptF [Smithellaceae bacterium]|jgi:lipopolysaccharide export system permease protein|nr:MAG: Lipopolysaccharide export system permease protein LptF [Deltaproteobacteria bacterium ADurb.BinA014]HNZ30755.1 LPS export ABC transporter permease LptF [Smithellaceae bacterium]HPG52825.1 LPS export ABC transporter permease LptF [Smithellaceae bacterium]
MCKIIFRYIFKEITMAFFMILFVLTFVLLMGRILQIMDLMVNKGVSFYSIAKLITFLLPSFMTLTIPVALLIAILITMGKFSADNEITALKASGVSLMQIFYPVALASLITFVFTILISNFLMPKSNFATMKLLFEIATQNASVGIKEKVFNADFKDLLLYADRISTDGHYMEGVLISDKRIIDEPNTILAKRAFLVSNPDLMLVKMRLENGSIHTVNKDFKNYRKIDFERYDINLDLSSNIISLGEEHKRSKDLTIDELLKKMKNPSIDKTTLREMAIELHKKFSIPLSCIFFGLLALPLGIRSHRAVKSRGFAMGIILATLYYLLRIGGEALAETGYLSPEIGVWMPNVIFAVLGIYLFIIAYKEISPLHLVKVFLWQKINH